MSKVDGPAVRLVDATDAAWAGGPADLAVTLGDIAGACRGWVDGSGGRDALRDDLRSAAGSKPPSDAWTPVTALQA
jgi:hypothetical protein